MTESDPPTLTAPERRRIPLRWSDMDPLGHLRQAAYHELLEDPRGAMIRRLGSVAPDTFVMARVELNYRAEVTMREPHVDVELSLEEIGRRKFVLGHRMFSAGGQLAADGRSVLVAWDTAERCSRELTDIERGRLEAWLRAPAEA